MNYDEARAEIRKDREHYGSQWNRHLDRYGPVAYFYELVGIMGRLESLIVDDDVPEGVPSEVVAEAIEDKLLDIGNYASFMYNWIQAEKHRLSMQLFKDTLP